MEVGRIGFVLTADDSFLLNSIEKSGRKAGDILGRTTHQSATSEIDRGFKRFGLDDSKFALAGKTAGDKYSTGVRAQAQAGLSNLSSLVSSDFVKQFDSMRNKVASFVPSKGSAPISLAGTYVADPAPRKEISATTEVTPDSLLEDKQAQQLSQARSRLRESSLKRQAQFLPKNSIERLNLDEQLAIEKARAAHEVKLSKLRQELAKFVQQKQMQVKAGTTGGIDHNAAIGRTYSLITAEQAILDSELKAIRSKSGDGKLDSQRQTRTQTINSTEELRQTQSRTNTTQLSANLAAVDPRSQVAREIKYKVEVAGIGEKYDRTKVEQDVALLQLREKRSDKLASGQTGGFDYSAAISRQQEIIRLTEASRSMELGAARDRRSFEVKAEQESLAAAGRGANRSREKEASSMAGSLSSANFRVESASASNVEGQRNAQYKGDVDRVTRDRDGSRKELEAQVKELEVQRQGKVERGDVGGVDYTQEINAKQELIRVNEELRGSELKNLQITYIQDREISKRADEDRKLASSRQRRDAAQSGSADRHLTDLNNRLAGNTDPIAVAAVEQEIAQYKLQIDRDRQLQQLRDKRVDLVKDRSRFGVNQKLGIKDAGLESVNFGAEIEAIDKQIGGTDRKYQGDKAALTTNFQTKVSEKFKGEQRQLMEEVRSLRMESLKTTIASADDEVVKVGVQIEIDRADVAHRFEQVIQGLDDQLKKLNQRRAVLVKSGLPTGDVDGLITQVGELKGTAGKNQTSALANLNIRSPQRVAIAEAEEARKRLGQSVLIGDTRLGLGKGLEEKFMQQGDYRQASVVGRSVAIGEEDKRYYQQQAGIKSTVAAAQAQGIQFSPDQLAEMNSNIDKLHELNLGNVNAQFDDMARSISRSNKELVDLSAGSLQTFLADAIGGSKSIGDAFGGMLRSITQGMSQMLAKKITTGLLGGDTPGSKGDSGFGGILRGIGGFLGFADGGVVPVDLSHQALRLGNNPIAAALKREGSNAILAALTPGERILNLQETAAYHDKYPSGILNYASGGIAGMANLNLVTAGSARSSSTSMGGDFNVNVDHGGSSSQPAVDTERLNGRIKSAIRDTIADEMRTSGMFDRYRR